MLAFCINVATGLNTYHSPISLQNEKANSFDSPISELAFLGYPCMVHQILCENEFSSRADSASFYMNALKKRPAIGNLKIVYVDSLLFRIVNLLKLTEISLSLL